MITIQKEREIKRHPSTSQYSCWINLTENWKETEFIYIFSHPFREWFMKTDEEILTFIDKIIGWNIENLLSLQYQNNKSIFDNIRYRFVFQISKDINNENRVAFTSDISDDDKIVSFYFSKPEDDISMK